MHEQTAIRRRPDGSIDMDFYADRAAGLRSQACRQAAVEFGQRLRALAVRVAAGERRRPIAC